MPRRLRSVVPASAWLAAALVLAGCGVTGAPPADDSPAAAQETADLVLVKREFAELPGWNGESHADVLPVLLKSCGRIVADAPADQPFGGNWRMGTVGQWREICEDAAKIRPGNQVEAKYLFESRFQPYEVRAGEEADGLFTGYYEPELNGAWSPGGAFRHPIHSRPKDLVSADLGKFRDAYKGEYLAGRVVDDNFVPYPTRQEIDQGALTGQQLEILWVDDPVDLFFLHVQGSGRIVLPDGSSIRVGYAGRNGHRYTPIGRELVARGVLKLEDVTLRSIRTWLDAHPAAAQEVMWKNRSYIFFRVVEGDGPIGAQGVPLTARRSLAVDRKHFPLGIPLWLSTTLPSADADGGPTAFRQLMVAQDTGSAIQGPVRGDVFVGHGAGAGNIAGAMKQQGRYWALLPKAAEPPTPPPQS